MSQAFRDAVNGQPGVDWQPIGPYVDKSYLDYSLSVILSRAIPDVRDGLKPVHRRILFAMNKLGLSPSSMHKKSARVVGDVIGKYHPHGDASVYDAMVLMSQDFSLRHPLLDGQGNWGSIDGDSPAAMRYTECRMSEYSKLLLEEIGKGTVEFRPNYDGNDEEPVCLPARLPMALLNDQTGIAVGMAADIPGHNLKEVVKASIALFKKPTKTLKGLMGIIKGPDFPCGGQLTTPREELAEIYETGRGMLTVRGNFEVKKDADGWHMVFTELPPKVSPEQILQELDAISNPQPKKKKKGAAAGKAPKGAGAIDPEQRAAKQALLSRVSEINNGAGNDTGPVYIEIYPKSYRQKPEELANYLFSVTSLETRVKVNMNLLNLEGLPAQMGLLDILREWNEFRFDTVTRRTKFRLDKVEARLHILEGFLKVLIDIDEVIKIIRHADDDQIAKAEIMERWTLSEIQADKILDMKLRQLTKLDELAIEKEAGDLREERTRLTLLLDDYDAMVAQIITELEEDAEKFGTPRRTLIEEAERADFDDSVVDEPVTIILSRKGFARARVGHNIELDGLGFKDGDSLHSAIETRTTSLITLFDNKGRAYTVAASLIPGGRGDGIPITSVIEIQEKAKLVSMFAAAPKDKLLLASSIGYGFVTEVENLLARNKAGKSVLNTGDGVALKPVLLNEETINVAVLNTSGLMSVYPISEIGEYPKGKGNKLLQLKSGEELATITAFSDTLELQPKRGKSMVQLKGEELEGYIRKRGSRGRVMPKRVATPEKKSTATLAVQDELF